METLDRSQPYGEVCGASDGHRYEQNGKLYDNHGNLFVPPEPEPTTQAPSGDSQPPAAGGPSIRLADGQVIVLPEDRAALLALANAHLPTKIHPQTGAAKLRKALMDAFPVEPVTGGAQGVAGSTDQVDQQLAS